MEAEGFSNSKARAFLKATSEALPPKYLADKSALPRVDDRIMKQGALLFLALKEVIRKTEYTSKSRPLKEFHCRKLQRSRKCVISRLIAKKRGYLFSLHVFTLVNVARH